VNFASQILQTTVFYLQYHYNTRYLRLLSTFIQKLTWICLVCVFFLYGLHKKFSLAQLTNPAGVSQTSFSTAALGREYFEQIVASICTWTGSAFHA
jgi:hypothetical protein